MLTVGIVVAVLASLGVGFTLGWGAKTHYVVLSKRTRELEEAAREQGRIDIMTQPRPRPSINPPSNFYRGDV